MVAPSMTFGSPGCCSATRIAEFDSNVIGDTFVQLSPYASPDTKVLATPSCNRAPSRLVAPLYRTRYHWVYATDHTQTWNRQA
jgi:hypothetical protein